MGSLDASERSHPKSLTDLRVVQRALKLAGNIDEAVHVVAVHAVAVHPKALRGRRDLKSAAIAAIESSVVESLPIGEFVTKARDDPINGQVFQAVHGLTLRQLFVNLLVILRRSGFVAPEGEIVTHKFGTVRVRGASGRTRG